MSIPPARRYAPDSPMAHGKSTAPNSRVNHEISTEHQPEPIETVNDWYKIFSFVRMIKLVEWRAAVCHQA